jgi:hypothetical protein
VAASPVWNSHPEQLAVVAPEPRRIPADDLEVHNWLSHCGSLPAAALRPSGHHRGGCPRASSYLSTLGRSRVAPLSNDNRLRRTATAGSPRSRRRAGVIKLVGEADRKPLVGGSGMAPAAGEVVGFLALASRRTTRSGTCASSSIPIPSSFEASRMCSGSWISDVGITEAARASSWMMNSNDPTHRS